MNVHPTLRCGRRVKALLSALKITNTVQETFGTGDGAASGLSISMGARLKCWGCSKSRSVVKLLWSSNEMLGQRVPFPLRQDC